MLMVNDADTATITQTIGDEVATLPVTNVQNPSNSRVFRTMDIVQTQLLMTWPTPILMSGIALNRINMSNSGTWHVEVFSDIAMTNLVHDSLIKQVAEQKMLGEVEFFLDNLVPSVVEMKLRACDHWFEDVVTQAVRITLVDVNNEFGFIDISRIYAGIALQPKVNFSYGHKSGWISSTKQRRTNGGSVHAKKRAKPRKLAFALKYLTEMDRPHFYNALQQVGDDTSWYISMFPGVGGQKERHYAMACMFQSLPDIEAAYYNNFKTDFNVGEA